MRDFMVNKVQIHEEANPLTTENVWHLDGDKLPKGSLEQVVKGYLALYHCENAVKLEVFSPSEGAVVLSVTCKPEVMPKVAEELADKNLGNVSGMAYSSMTRTFLLCMECSEFHYKQGLYHADNKGNLRLKQEVDLAKECKQVLERAEQEAKDKTPEELIEEAGLTVADGDTVSALNGVL